MKKAIKILLTAAAVAGLSLIPAGFPASEAFAAAATPGNAAREESGSGGQEEENKKHDDPKPAPFDHVTATLTADKPEAQVGEKVTLELRFSGLDNPEKYVTGLSWDAFNNSNGDTSGISITNNHFKFFVISKKPQTVTVHTRWEYTDPLIQGNSVAFTSFRVLPEQTASFDSGGGSGSSGGSSGSSSSSKSSKQAKAPSPLAPVTPIVTDLSGISHFGNAIIAQPPAAYPEQARAGLIMSGTWSKTSTGFWQLNAGGRILRNCWLLVSDALSQDPIGNASWFYFDENGHMAAGWKWIAASDGLRCYYFNQEDGKLYGALIMNGTTPDGFMVDETGAWMENGIVKTIPVS